MVTCELDKDISGEILGWKLPVWQALLLHRVLPSCGGLIVYLTLICFDFALIIEHYQNGDDGIGAFCIVLMILPALISLMFTLASPPPGLQTELSAFSVNIEKNDVIWIVTQFVNTIFFPIAAIGRYCFLIFWWVEAVVAAHDGDEERAKEALSTARAPSPLELYLFLQSFIHAAPHTIVNILDLMGRFSDSTFDKVSVQAVSIIASSLRMASTATIYRRFEREKLTGRKYPWQKKSDYENDIINNNKGNNEKLDTENKTENIYEPVIKRDSRGLDSLSNSRENVNSDLIQFSPRNTGQSLFYDYDLTESDSSEYLPPVSPNKTSSSPYNSDDEYVRPISILDKVAPRRRDTEYTIEKVRITPPPAMPAPRPGSFAVWAEKMVENAESIPMWLSAPPRRKYCDEIIHVEPDVPRVLSTYRRGLEPQDATAALVHYLGWYSFFVARLLSIACFINFFPVLAIIILLSHYQVMLLFLIVPQASTVKRGFYIFLAFIYLFCLMEFKIRFRHVRVWHMFWMLVCSVEIIIFTALWASINNSFDSWWRIFTVQVVLVSLFLSYVCFSVYFILLQPRETIIFIRKNTVM